MYGNNETGPYVLCILLIGTKLEFAKRTHNFADEEKEPVEGSCSKNGATMLYLGQGIKAPI